MSIFLMHRRRLKIAVDEVGFGRDFKFGGLGYYTQDKLAWSIYLSSDKVVDILVVGSDVYFNCTETFVQVRNNAFRNNLNITSYIDYNDKTTKLHSQAFNGATNLKEVQMLNLRDCGSRRHFQGTLVEDFYFPAAVTMNNCLAIWIAAQVKTVHMPNLISMSRGADMVSQAPNFRHWNTPKLAVMGGASGYTGPHFFRNITPGALITVSDVLATSDNGAMNNNLVYAQSLGCTIEFVSNP